MGVIVFVTALLLLRGDLVPKKTVDGRLADRDKIIAAHKETIVAKENSLVILKESARVTNKLLDTLDQKAGSARDEN